jgi:hypothetical protein
MLRPPFKFVLFLLLSVKGKVHVLNLTKGRTMKIYGGMEV